jgi:hypothetical protein
MATNIEIKASIDANITNKTALGSISNNDVGSEIKSVVDYIDQEVATVSVPTEQSIVKIKKTTITPAEVYQMFTSPITILESNVVGKILYPTSIYIKRNTGDAYILATNTLNVINDFGANMGANINPNCMQNTPDGFMQNTFSISQNASGITSNAVYKLKALTADPTNGVGTGTLEVYLTYVEITL